MRQLATIRTISDIIPIAGKDLIALAIIDGWSVIVKKTEFAIGDSCVYFEIDSFLPNDPRYTFLKHLITYDGKQGYRIKTMKMAGCLSQGLALPLSMFPELSSPSGDVSDALNIIKYDLAIQEVSQSGGLRAGRAKGSFPSFIPKTDEPRIQNLMHYFSQFKDDQFEETLKLDGSSMTCYKIKRTPTFFDKVKEFFGFATPLYHFGVCSRNLELKPAANQTTTFNNSGKISVYDQSDFWKAAVKYDIEARIPAGYAVQGELIGPKIQANHEKVTDLEYYIFNVFDISTGLYLLPEHRRQFCELHGLPHVPVISPETTPFSMTLEQLLSYVDTESMNPGTISEGRVFKHVSKPVSFKVINNRYLLKVES